MTSLAFILGVVPLVMAEGAGAEMRRSLGTAVFSGMLGVTLFGILLTPVFFYRHRRARRNAKVPTRRQLRWLGSPASPGWSAVLMSALVAGITRSP